MSLMALALCVLAILAAGYLLYGSFIARQYRLDDARVTPATERNDGVDFVPARPFYLLGQHFSAIAAAGPIVGPIVACMTFGWLPCMLWIVLGVVFIGAVHDFSALVASVRHKANSVAEIAREHLGQRAFLAMVLFIWLALVYVIVAFTSVTADTFRGVSEELAGLDVRFNKGGAVAAASTMYLALALVMGIVQRVLRPPMWLLTAVFVPATLGVVWLGTKIDTVLSFDAPVWHVAILVYCLVAAMLPMWLLQQPRGYLGGFVLYLALGIGVAGILLGGFEIRQPAIKPMPAPEVMKLTQHMFPFLFVTIACGACSGFHGLICGGTTSKQVAKESHCKPVAFGAMLLEGFVAVIALGTVMIVAQDQVGGRGPSQLYGDGLATFLTVLFPESVRPSLFVFAATFGAMAFSTFVFDTLDVSVRLGRYLLQELTGIRSRVAGFFAALATVSAPFVVLRISEPGSYQRYWTLFGTSNQLLASLTLLGISVWLVRAGKRCWYTAVPMVFVMSVTLTALVMQVAEAARTVRQPGIEAWSSAWWVAWMNGGVSVALVVLAGVFVVEAVRSLRRPIDRPAAL
ncbi:MAG: carbon starvation protein A [Phycisphaeraceae bacterium]|nr:carbon starvation protein A [Phycisphaerae bacterium]MBX3393247.1 carbon starvation protein A [Phycisphaeraceae bacterium]